MPEKAHAASTLCILDCLSGERLAVQKSPFVIGSLPSSDLRLTSPLSPQVLCTIIHDEKGFHVSFADQVLLDGSPAQSLRTMPGEEHSVVGRGCMIALKHTSHTEAWLAHCATLLWNIYDISVHDWLGPFSTQQMRAWIARLAADAREQLLLVPAGMEEVGFFVRDVQELLAVGTARDREVEEQAWYRRQAAGAETSAS